MTAVVDASVACKWFFQETGSDAGNEQFRIVSGADALAQWLKDGLSPDRTELRLNTVALALEWSAGKVTLRCAHRAGALLEPFRARAIVIAVPHAVLRANALGFDPELPDKRRAVERSLDYMGLTPGTRLDEVKVDRVFIGSCTNGRIEDLREVARVVNGRNVNGNVKAMIVPGSGLVKEQAEAEGLDKIFLKAGFEWREPGCSMCLAMNPDKLAPGERCASTSNRNFEGRQGKGGRTHLVSPAVAAATAILGHFATPDDLPETR